MKIQVMEMLRSELQNTEKGAVRKECFEGG